MAIYSTTIIMHLMIFFLALFLVPAFAAPLPEKKPPQTFKPGDIVGVRPGEYETKPKGDWKDVSIHPGVVLGTPHPVTGKFPVAMISSKLPDNPPQVPVKNFYHASGLDGNIRLDPPKQIGNAKAWKNKETGERQSPMSDGDMQRLRNAMLPHQGWRSPSPPGPPPRPPSRSRIPVPVARPQGQQPPHVNAYAGGSRPPVPAAPQRGQRPLSPSRIPVPVGQRPPHVKAHASSSRLAVPARGPNSQGAPPKPPAAAHTNQMRSHTQGPRPHPQGPPQRNLAHPSLPRRPPSPQRGPTGGKGKQPMRGKREFIRRILP